VERVTERLAAVGDRIATAGGDWRAVTVVAVTKGWGIGQVREAYAAGLRDFGENYAQELVGKAGVERFGGAPLTTPPRWHYLGSVQRRKVRDLARWVHLWQGVDRLAEGAEIARHAPGGRVLVQVNVTGGPRRNGCTWEQAPGLVEGLRAAGLDVRGLMCIGPEDDPRPQFRRLARLAARLELAEVSMGMSGDLEVAVQEGATMVRVGTALFGPRSDPLDLRR
jgi:pyridoxal phosphate enzyme (YggS family)